MIKRGLGGGGGAGGRLAELDKEGKGGKGGGGRLVELDKEGRGVGGVGGGGRLVELEEAVGEVLVVAELGRHLIKNCKTIL